MQAPDWPFFGKLELQNPIPKRELSSLYTSRCGRLRTPKGFQAISRGLSEATPPDGKPNKTSTPEGSQSFPHELGYHRTARLRLAFAVFFERVPRFIGRLLRPLRGRMWYSITTGCVASLNPRLIAGNPTGCNRPDSYTCV